MHLVWGRHIVLAWAHCLKPNALVVPTKIRGLLFHLLFRVFCSFQRCSCNRVLTIYYYTSKPVGLFKMITPSRRRILKFTTLHVVFRCSNGQPWNWSGRGRMPANSMLSTREVWFSQNHSTVFYLSIQSLHRVKLVPLIRTFVYGEMFRWATVLSSSKNNFTSSLLFSIK